MMQQLLPVYLDCVVMVTGEARHCGGGVEGWPGGRAGQSNKARFPSHPLIMLVTQQHRLRQRLEDVLRVRPTEV